MKILADHLGEMPLAGEVESITVSELRARVGECLNQVSMGKSLCIKRRGKIVAFLVHPLKTNMTHEVLSDGSCDTLAMEDQRNEKID